MDRYGQVVERFGGKTVVALATCWTEDGEIDFAAMKRYVNWLCTQKVPAITTTYGYSEMCWMSDDDVWRLSADLAEAIAGRCVFIASTLYWPPKVTRKFLKHADKAGVDAVKVQLNQWLMSGSAEQKARYWRQYFDLIKDAAPIPLMLWANFFGEAEVPVETVVDLARDPQIVGMKNDADPFYYYYDLLRATTDENFVVMSGGQMRNWVYGYGVGKPALLSGISGFRPDIDLTLHELLVADRFREAWEHVERYEDPFRNLWGGLHPQRCIHSALHMHGLYPNNLPGMMIRAHTPAECEQLRQGLERILGPIQVQAL